MLWENAGHQTWPTVLLLMYGSFHLPWPSLGLYEEWVCKTKNSQGQNCLFLIWPSPHVALVVKNLPVNAGNVRDTGSIPGSGRSPGGGHGNPLQFLCLENPVDRGAWGGYSSQGCKKLDMTEQLSMHNAQHSSNSKVFVSVSRGPGRNNTRGTQGTCWEGGCKWS